MQENGTKTTRPDNEIDPSTLLRDYRGTARLLSYLLRATMRKTSADTLGQDRYWNRARELADSLLPLVVAERNVVGMYRALCARFDIDATGSDSQYGPIEAWLPEGRIRWDRALGSIDLRMLRFVTHDLRDLIATFACEYPSEADEQAFEGLSLIESTGQWKATLPTQLIAPRAWRTVWTLTKPMAHGHDDKYGNVVLFRRQREINPVWGKACDVPFMAGNAVRGLWRRLVMGDYLTRVGLTWTDLHPTRSHSLKSGGAVAGGADKAKINLATRKQTRTLCPAWDLIAGCIDQQVMMGRLRVHDATLVCKETAWKVKPFVAPDMEYQAFEDSIPSAVEMTTLRLGTRQRDRELDGGDGVQMLWNTELLQAGSQIVHTLQPAGMESCSEVTLSALAHLLALFRSDAAVGASTARGYGQIAFDPYQPGPETPALPSPEIYTDYLVKHRDAIRIWLTQGTVTDEPPPKSGGRGGKKTKEKPVPVPDATPDLFEEHDA